MRGRGRLIAAVVMLASMLAIATALDAAANHSTLELASTGPTGGNGNFEASFGGASVDGSRVFFTTDEALSAADQDDRADIYERSGSTTTLISTGPIGGNPQHFDALWPRISADGARVVFETNERLVSSDTDSATDVYERHGSTTTHVSTGPAGGNLQFADATAADISADGARVFFRTAESLVSADTDTSQDIYEHDGSTTTLISTGPTGGNGEFDVGYNDTPSDGSGVLFFTPESLVSADTDAVRDVYERAGSTTTLVSTGPTATHGPFPVESAVYSEDGTRIFFHTPESLVSADTDTQFDVYERSGATTTLISTGPTGGNGPGHAEFRAASSDGTRALFHTSESLVSADTDSQQDLYERSGSTTTLISIGPAGGNGPLDAHFRAATPDGTHVYFRTNESLVSADTDARYDFYERSGSTTTLITTGPAGGNGPFDAFSFLIPSSDGARVFFETDEALVSADTDSVRDTYERSGSTTTLISTGPAGGNGAFNANLAGASADGTRAYFHTGESLLSADTDANLDLYVAGIASTAGYPRPQGASPLKVALVPAYEECTEPNAGHGGAFSFEACNPPQMISDHLTIGTPDANGKGAKSVGSLQIAAIVGSPSTPGDQADVSLQLDVTDIRRKSDLEDYTGELRATATLRLTDKLVAGTAPGTTVDFPLTFEAPCAATGDTTVGATCSVATTLDTLVGGSAPEGKRTIFKVGEVDVYDGGADGDAATAPNTLFAWQGIFLP